MIHQLMDNALRARGLICLTTALIAAWGIYTYHHMAVDAFPDISPIMVPIFVEAHGMAPEEIERQITTPIENAMRGLPGVVEIKSTSAFGLASVYVYFSDQTDMYFARQLTSERLSAAAADLPDLHEPPVLGPISTGLGQIFMYYLTADETADTRGLPVDVYLRDLNDWVVKRQLQSTPGVTDILSMGGHILQFNIHANPLLMKKFGVTLDDLTDAIRKNNQNVGGQYLVLGDEEAIIRGIGLLDSIDDLRDVAILTRDGIPLPLNAVANVEAGRELRRGVVTLNGEREVVAGLVLKLYGENTSKVITRLHENLERVQATLPPGVHVVPYYDQADLVDRATGTIRHALAWGALLVMLALLVFMGNLRSALIVVITLPICALIAVIMMGANNVSANLMSLGGIAVAIGMLGDGAVVMVENAHRHLGLLRNRDRDRLAVIGDAAREVGRPIAFSIAIIIMVFLPIYSLEGIEGKMFRPMAFTITFALLGSMATALLLAPALSSFLLRHHPEHETRWMVLLKRGYRRILASALKHKHLVVAGTLAAWVSSLALLPRLGTEFIPTLEEGSILIGVTMAPSISLDNATETILLLEQEIMALPEVENVLSRIGRPDAGSHPHPVNTAEIHIELKSGSVNKDAVIEQLDHRLSRYPGVVLNFTQPIQNAFDELLSGIKAQLAIKIFGEDLSVLQQLAEDVRHAIEDIPGVVDLAAEQSLGQPQLQIEIDRPAAARYGISANDVNHLVEMAIGGEPIDILYLDTRRYRINLRYQETFRADTDAIRNLLVPTADDTLVALEQIATLRLVDGPMQIQRENNQRRWIVQANARGRDLGSLAEEIRQHIDNEVDLPPGYVIELGGQFENQQRAMHRLSLIVPVVLLAVFILLWMTFGRVRDAAVIFVNVPLALIGGVVGLAISGEYLSVPAAIGFIALFGIAVQNGVVLVHVFNQLHTEGHDPETAIITGAMLRLRPVLMTACTTMLGLLPLLLAQGPGSEVQRPLAVVVVCGMFSSTALTLFVIPTVYRLIDRRN